MRHIRYSLAMSLDGFIAGPNHEIDWIVMDPDIDFASMMSRFDTLVMGRRSYEALSTYEGGDMPNLKALVVSRTLKQSQVRGATVVRDLEMEVGRMRTEQGKDIWLFGGGSLFQSMLDAKMVDSVEIAIIPVLLGDGIPMLPAARDRAQLRLVGSKVYEKTGIVFLEYDVL